MHAFGFLLDSYETERLKTRGAGSPPFRDPERRARPSGPGCKPGRISAEISA